MRIAVDVSSIIQPSAGVGVYTKKILTELIKTYTDDEFVLFFTSGKKIDTSKLPLGNNVKVLNLGWPSKIFNLFQVVFSWPKIDYLVKADVFLFPNLQLWRWSAQAKVLMTVHDLSFAVMPWAFSLKMRLWHYFVNPKINLPLTQKIISVSDTTKNDLISLFGIEKDKIETIYHGVDQPTVYDNSRFNLLKNKYSLPEKFLLFVGTLEPRKNLRLLIDALNVSTQKSPLVIVGRLGWLNRGDFEMIINNPRIKWLGALNDDDRDTLIAYCQALVWPSLYEGFGLPPIEAAMYSKQIISGIGGSLQEVSGEFSYGFDSTNNSNLITALNKIEQLKTIEIDKNRLEEKYSWREAAKKLYHILYETSQNTY